MSDSESSDEEVRPLTPLLALTYPFHTHPLGHPPTPDLPHLRTPCTASSVPPVAASRAAVCGAHGPARPPKPEGTQLSVRWAGGLRAGARCHDCRSGGEEGCRER
jgi:hypothetical protein